MLARLELEMTLAAIASLFRDVEIAAKPQHKLDDTVPQFASLPMKLRPA